ncbi:MAG: alpha/beta hydrolase [Betaproteobacteria bacterium]|nr:alpha/beta hydrolase [Betaproteobacteria bacterium]
MALIVFSHANSFPAGTYRTLLDALAAGGHTVHALERFGHDPRYPVSNNWPHLVEQLADFAGPAIASHPSPAFLVGHSLGGFLSLMCAAQYPRLGGRGVDGVVLLDSPLLGGWRASVVALAKHIQLVGVVSPARLSRKRRTRWPDLHTAREHFRHKRPFRHWDEQALEDYLVYGTRDDLDRFGQPCRRLVFDRSVETRIYNTLPHNLERLLRKHPPRCPVGFIGGTLSLESRQVGLGLTRKLAGGAETGRVRFIEGTHLFPMERPRETAEAITTMLERMQNHHPPAA